MSAWSQSSWAPSMPWGLNFIDSQNQNIQIPPFKPWYITGRILPLHCIRVCPITLWNYPQWQKSIHLIHWHPGGSSDSIKPIDRCRFDISFMPRIYVFCMFHLPFWLILCHRRAREIQKGLRRLQHGRNGVEIKIAIFLPDLGPHTAASHHL